jgi:hypothetical protein
MKKYMKTFMMFLATVLGFVGAALTGGITNPEWVNIAILSVGAAAVFTGPNVPGAKYTKAILAILTATLTVLASVILGGITTGELYQIGAAALGAIAVFGVKNEPNNLGRF